MRPGLANWEHWSGGTELKYITDARPQSVCVTVHPQSAAWFMALLRFDIIALPCCSVRDSWWRLLQEAESKLLNG